MNPRKGDTVRLAQSVTTAEFGLALCDDDGAGQSPAGRAKTVKPRHC